MSCLGDIVMCIPSGHWVCSGAVAGDLPETDAFSPHVSHMSGGTVTLRRWPLRAGFHSAYYHRSSSLQTGRARGWTE